MASGGARNTRDMEPRVEENLREPYWKGTTGSFIKETIVNGICSVYNLALTKVVDALFIKLQLGKKNLQKNHKVIMMVGQTGAGKSTLINAMINYILGVEWKDNVRIKLIEEEATSQAQSQTSTVTCYEINHQEGFKIPYSLTILDTPGFGHTGGTEGDKQIVKQIRECFLSPAGVQHIDAVCFVVKVTDVRLSDSQKYVFDSVLRIFGKDIEENIIFCVTYCDDSKPKVINTLVEASVPCAKDVQDRPVYFCFNNSDIPVHSDNEINGGSSKIRELHWEESMENMEKFFTFLPNQSTKSLTLTHEVLKERRALEITIEGLIPKMQEQTLKSHESEKIKNILKKHKAEIEKNKHFEYEEKVTLRIKIPSDQTSVNCRECESTCHHPCKVTHSTLAYLCEVFYWSGDCRVCGHGQSKHFCENHICETYVETETKTYEELKKKYEGAEPEKKMSVQAVCDKLTAETQTSEREALKLIETAKKCLQRLQEIALKPELLTVADYIDRLIKDEASNQKEGYTERIKSLEKLKQQIMEKDTKSQK